MYPATEHATNMVCLASQVTHNDGQDVYAPYSGSYGLMSLADGPGLSPASPSATLQVREHHVQDLA